MISVKELRDSELKEEEVMMMKTLLAWETTAAEKTLPKKFNLHRSLTFVRVLYMLIRIEVKNHHYYCGSYSRRQNLTCDRNRPPV